MRNTLVPLLVNFFGLLSLGGARVLGYVVGSIIFLIKGRDHRITSKNIRLCFPELDEQESNHLVHTSLVETTRTALEAAIIWHNSWEWLQGKIVAIEGEDILRSELAEGQGVIVLAPHLGNWEVVAPYVASIGSLTAMYKPFPITKLDQLIYAGRSKLGINLAPTNRKGVSMLLKALQQGTMVGVLPDQLPEKGAGAEPTLIFGQPAMTMTLIHSLVDRTKCRVVSVFAMRVKGGFKLVTLAASPEIYSADINESLRGLNLSIEACVRLAPAQYQWEYNRFRKLPAHKTHLRN